jgi:HAD superfamily hydrolase (TIGR01509 family)
LKKIKLGFLWDMDGTIVDTKRAHFEAWRDAVKSFGYDLDHETFEVGFGRTNRAILPIYIGFKPDQDLADEMIKVKEQLFRKIALESSTLVAGVESWLAAAKKAGIPQAIASSAPIGNIGALMDHFKLNQYFDFFMSGANLPAKPEPDVFLEAAQQFDQKIAQLIVIEDSVAGVKAGKSAGMQCIGVATHLKKSELAMADFVVNDFTMPLVEVLSELGIAGF